MSVPNYQTVVQSVRDSRTWDFTTKEGLCAYTNAVIVALYEVDPQFGCLVKTEGQNHCTDPIGRLCATDVALYKVTGQVVDFIASAGYGTPPPSNDVVWMEGPMYEYPASSWFAPVPGADTGGGGGDTGGGDGGGATDAELAAITAQLDRLEALAIDQKLFLSNINDQINLMAGAVNAIQAAQNPVLSGTLPRQGQELNLTPRAPE